MSILKFALLGIAYDLHAIQKEVRELVSSQSWQPHYNLQGYKGEWTVLSLRSAGGSQNGLAESLNGEGYVNTELMDLCPSVKQLTDNLACEKASVRLLHLAAGASVGEHKDLELSFENGEARLHFPIFTNPNVEFFIEDKRVYMRAGECWYLNANLSHRLTNSGNFGRIHLVIDCRVNDWLKKVFDKCCILKDEITEEEMTLRNKQCIIQTVSELRRQKDSPVAQQLAGKLERQLGYALSRVPNHEIDQHPGKEKVLQLLTHFVRSLGIDVMESRLSDQTFLPGIFIDEGRIIIDGQKLKYPGDILHEAGHIAVSEPGRRPFLNEDTITKSSHREAEEMMAIAWSYAACKHLNLHPSVVFHEGGYGGGSDGIIENFEQGHFFGTPMLQWCGMTRQPPPGSQAVDCFPRMIRWMRE